MHYLLVDTYYLGLERDAAKYQRIAGKEWRHTAGARVRGEFGNANVELEAAYQFGAVASTQIAAWTLATSVDVHGRKTPLKPVLTLGFGATSGDGGSGSSTLGTFNPLFPRGAYFGLIAANGPGNNVSPHAALAVTLPYGFTSSVEA